MGFGKKCNLSLRIFIVAILIVIAFSTIYSTAHFTSTTYSNGHIVILIWDAVERTVLYELLRNGSLPNLSKLNVYNLTCNLEYRAATTTRPQHAIMLSGYLANVTKITGNNPDQWQGPLGSKSLFLRVHKLLGKDYYIVGFAAKPKSVSVVVVGVDKWEEITGFFMNRVGFDKFISCRTWIDPMSADMPRGAMETVLNLALVKTKFLYFFHFADPDAYGHSWGVDSKQYRKAIRDCDMVLGKLMAKLPPDTIYIVTSDHGFGTVDKYEHIRDPNTFIASNLRLRDGYMVDVAPTIYDILDVDTSQFIPKLHGVSLFSGS